MPGGMVQNAQPRHHAYVSRHDANAIGTFAADPAFSLFSQ